MESKQLRHFLAVAEYGNFTHAANALHIAQPALSISIKKFEQTLGVSLFRRDERTVALTQEGEILLPYARRVVQQLLDAELAIKELRGLEKGEVRLGAPSMMGSYFFPPIMMAFKRCYPNLKLTLIDAGTQSIRRMLLEGALDLGVIIDDNNVPAELDIDPLFSSQMVAVVANEHPLAKHHFISQREFLNHELVMFKAGYFHREFIDAVSVREGIEPKFSFETNLLAMILSIVKSQSAISALLDLVVQHEPQVCGIPFEPPVTLNLALAWRKEGYLSIADRTFIDFVKQSV